MAYCLSVFFFKKKRYRPLPATHPNVCVCVCARVCACVGGCACVCVCVWSGEVAMNCSILYISAARTQTACLLKTGPWNCTYLLSFFWVEGQLISLGVKQPVRNSSCLRDQDNIFSHLDTIISNQILGNRPWEISNAASQAHSWTLWNAASKETYFCFKHLQPACYCILDIMQLKAPKIEKWKVMNGCSHLKKFSKSLTSKNFSRV